MGRTIGLCNAIKSRHGPATGVAKMKRAAKEKRRRKRKMSRDKTKWVSQMISAKPEKC